VQSYVDSNMLSRDFPQASIDCREIEDGAHADVAERHASQVEFSP
jgi:hypothetical protein